MEHAKGHVEHGKLHTYEEEHFRFNAVKDPIVHEAPLKISPELLEKAHTDVYCLTPFERRQIALYEKQQNVLKREKKRDQATRDLLAETMRRRFPYGVKDFDSPDNLDSDVYGEQAKKLHELAERKEAHQQRRYDCTSIVLSSLYLTVFFF